MIPVRLKLRNFMCYRDDVPPLEFDGIHLACLAGDNGHGKSAIIDAITWALWGKARAGSDDDLIHTGRNEMEVEFDFTVGDQLYRIVRKRTRPKKRGSPGQPSLELQIGGGSGFLPITGNTISQTQEKLIDILHMDYDTFINSAYLRQGHADEFTRQAPAKRKDILGNILGLAVYDELEERAREMSRGQEAERLQLESAIDAIDEELARRPDYEAELEQAQTELAAVENTAGEKEAGLNALRQKKELLQSKQAQLEELEGRIGSSARDLERWREQAKQHHARIKDFEAIIGRSDDIEEGYRKFAAARDASDALDKDFRQSVNLERQKSQLEARIKEAGQSLNTEHTVVQKEINTLEDRIQKLPELKKQLSQAQAQVRQLSEPETALREREQTIKELQTQVNYLESENARLDKEIGELTEKLDLISSQTEGKCPLCETELTREGLELIGAKYTGEKKTKTDLFLSNQVKLSRQKTELESRQREKHQAETELGEEKTRAQGQVSVLTKDITGIEEELQKLSGLKETLDDIEQRLAGRDFAVNEQAALEGIEAEMGKLDYDSAKHEQARQLLSQTQPYEAEKRKLDEAQKLITQEKDAAAGAEEAAQGLSRSLEAETQKREALAAELTGLPQLTGELARTEAEYRTLAAQRSRAQETVGSIKSKIQRCDDLANKKQENEARLTGVLREAGIYAELARAFGKTGIQALLIETALPDIESEANRLLGRMTDNRMHVKFETQRETKKGDVRETLDINISDELGTRNYEMFSGGEAFRINFAIRIALSRLLARRAGAPLPTLIIDEGFGTQDSAGMEKLIEAINSIQEDFDKILVITHMEDLKDAFPVRIDITKTAEGSMISVS
jgi:exonuclease SbcC